MTELLHNAISQEVNKFPGFREWKAHISIWSEPHSPNSQSPDVDKIYIEFGHYYVFAISIYEDSIVCDRTEVMRYELEDPLYNPQKDINAVVEQVTGWINRVVVHLEEHSAKTTVDEVDD